MEIVKNACLAFIGFSSGVGVAGGIFAFIAMIGVVPRMAQYTSTQKYLPVYEDAIIFGGIWGATATFVNYYIPVGTIGAIIIALAIGVFVGALAVSLAEVLNVIPVFARRARLTKGIKAIVLALALGKCTGSIIYFFMSNFAG